MIYYFGYGSNINFISLKAKGVTPISSRKGILKDWQLTFNVQHWFRHEGGMGNIVPAPNSNKVVEGVVHECNEDDLKSLDQMESYGVGYDRIKVPIETEVGIVNCYTYIGLPSFINNNCLPTKRYLNIIVKGAVASGLSESYINSLKNQTLFIPKPRGEFQHPNGRYPEYDVQSLCENQHLTALAGAVFDMREAREELECLFDFFGGKDMTLFHLKRLDTSDGTETIEDYIGGNISEYARQYLNNYLYEYSREYKYAGRYSYGK